MERRFEIRKQALIAECQVDSAVFGDVGARLAWFVQPFADCLVRSEQKEHAQMYCAGLLSDLRRKNAESIAYRQDQGRKNLQNFIGNSRWRHEPLTMELARQVGDELGQEDGVIALDPSAFPKKGNESAGVERQWCGRLGKIDNCQVGVYMGYVSAIEHALVDMRLYMPKSWIKDKRRREKCRVPKELRYKTRTQLALEMLDEKGHLLPHAWVTGDDEFGRAAWFRRRLRECNEQYLLAIPSPTTIRDLEADPPQYSGFGGVPKTRFMRVDRWREALSEESWTRVEVRDGEKGPLAVDIVTRRVQARDEKRNVGPQETLVVICRTDEAGKMIHDYYLSNAPFDTSLKAFARAAKAHHRIEECIQRGKSETGLADYEVRTYAGWHHHQTLSLIATWFLVQQSRRGKKTHSRHHRPADPRGHRPVAPRRQRLRLPDAHRQRANLASGTQSTCEVLPLEIAQQTATIEHKQTPNLEQ
jgi:SRSO17 transposase